MIQIVTDPNVPGVTRVSSDRSLPRPHVGVIGAIHGNERCGLEVLRRLEAAARDGALVPAAGTIVIIHGNPAASEAGRRYTRGGEDLNRLFDFAFETDLPRERWSPEHMRAHALRPVLEDLDTLLDLHSATWPTPAFAIINEEPRAAELASCLGLDFVTQGWSGPGLLMDKVTIGVLQRLGRPAISVECGQHDDAGSIEAAWDCALRFLAATGAIEGDAPARAPTFLEIVEIIRRPSENFGFTRAIRGLERLAAGEVLAADRIAELRVREPCWVLLPNDRVPVGTDMAFLAREAAPR